MNAEVFVIYVGSIFLSIVQPDTVEQLCVSLGIGRRVVVVLIIRISFPVFLDGKMRESIGFPCPDEPFILSTFEESIKAKEKAKYLFPDQ